MKQIFENQLAQIWKKWLIVEKHSGKLEFEINDFFFSRYTHEYNIEMFLMRYEEKLSERQIAFANHMLQVMVEVQNHEHMDKTLLRKEG